MVDLFLAQCPARVCGADRAGAVRRAPRARGNRTCPFFEALWQLSHGPARDAILAVLRRYAPLWLVQLPGLVSEPELERLQRQVAGATPERMRRELAQALDVLTADAPLVLVLEKPCSGVTAPRWTSWPPLAQRRAPAPLLVLGTYRPVDLVLHAHPLRGLVQELGGRGLVRELPLELLPAADVAASLAGRLGGPVAPPLAAFVHAHTDGHPLFLGHPRGASGAAAATGPGRGAVEHSRGVEARVAQLPQEVRQVLMRRVDLLPTAARQVLEVASVVGQAFAAAAVAAGTQDTVEAVDTVCDGLVAEQRFLADTGVTVWPDGTRGGGYRFHHPLYQQVLYASLGPTRRAQTAPPGGGPLGGRVWRPGRGHCGPTGPALRARG